MQAETRKGYDMILFAIVKREHALQIHRTKAFSDDQDSGMTELYSKAHTRGVLLSELPEYPGFPPWPYAIVAMDLMIPPEGREQSADEPDVHWWVTPAEALRYNEWIRVFPEGANDPLFADDRLPDNADEALVEIQKVIRERRAR